MNETIKWSYVQGSHRRTIFVLHQLEDRWADLEDDTDSGNEVHCYTKHPIDSFFMLILLHSTDQLCWMLNEIRQEIGDHVRPERRPDSDSKATRCRFFRCRQGRLEGLAGALVCSTTAEELRSCRLEKEHGFVVVVVAVAVVVVDCEAEDVRRRLKKVRQ